MGREVPTSPIAMPLSATLAAQPGTPTLASDAAVVGKGPPVDHLASVIASLRADPTAAPFLDPERTPADHVGAAVRDQRVTPALSAAQAASTRLASAVRDEVVLQKEALLAEVDAVAALEKEVATVETGVHSLASASGALADALAAPYEPMDRAVTSLANVQKAAALLRAIERFRFCTSKLSAASIFPSFSPTQKTSPDALPAAAEAIRELEELLATSSDIPLDKVDSVSKHIPAVRKAAVELRKRTGAMLRAGINNRDQPLITAAVVSFHALKVLPDRINAEIGRLLSDTQGALQKGLEPPRGASSSSGLSFPSSFGARSSGSGSASLVNGRPREETGRGANSATDDGVGLSRNGVEARTGTNGSATTTEKAIAPVNRIATDSGGGKANASEPSWEVWSRVEAMLDTVRDSCLKATLLQQILGKKYDEVEHVSLLHEPIASGFIDAVAKALGEQISLLARTYRQRAAAAQVFRALTADYPRLRALLVALSTRVHALVRTCPHPITSFEIERLKPGKPFSPSSVQLPIVPDRTFIETTFISSVAEVETHYLSASLDRLTSAVASAFDPSRAAPGEAEALAVARLCSAELTASRNDDELFATSVTNVATALRLYCSNAEDLAASQTSLENATNASFIPGGDGRTRNSGPVREWRLTRLHNGLVTLSTAAKRVLGADEEGAGPLPPQIAKEVTGMGQLADTLLQTPFAMCTARVARAIENIHTEDLTCDPGSDDGCSIYAMDVTAQLSMFASGVVLALARSRSLGQCTLTLAHRVLNLFVTHATLAYPLNEAARMRLATDMARVELAVESLCPVRMLGKSYLQIRALRQLVFVTDEELCSDPPLEETLAIARNLHPSAVAHHIFSRSRDTSFLHPHRRQNSPPREYAAWLDGHSEEDAWASVEKALEAYENAEDTKKGDWCGQYVALKALSGPLRESWTASRASEHW